MFERLLLLAVQLVIYSWLSSNLAERYGYAGTGFEEPDPLWLVFALGVLVVLAVLLPNAVVRPSDSILWLLASFVVVPTLSVSLVNPYFDTATKAAASGAVTLGFVIVAMVTSLGSVIVAMVTSLMSPTDRAPGARPGYLSRRLFAALLVCLIALAVATIVWGYGTSTFGLSWEDQYERRLAVRELSAPYPGGEYLPGWLALVLAPMLVVVALEWRQRSLIVLASVVPVLMFAFSGLKGGFVFLVVAATIWLSMRRANAGSRAPWFGALLTSGFIAVPTAIGWLAPSTLVDYRLTHRLGILPGILTHDYVSYAHQFGFIGFGQSWGKFYIVGADRTTAGYRVGTWLNPGAGTNANANPWADGYISSASLGVIIASVVVGLILVLFDRQAERRDRIVAGVTFGTVGFAFVNIPVHTAILTHGVLFAVLLVWLMPGTPGGRFSRSRPELAGPRMPGIRSRTRIVA